MHSACLSSCTAGFSEEFLDWAAADGLEQRLLDGIQGTKGPEASCKALFVADLLKVLVAGGHRTLVFSQSRVMLDILQVGTGCCCLCCVTIMCCWWTTVQQLLLVVAVLL
jgi:hypothetical protein